MRIYVVRHGESAGNVSKIHQTPDESLTELGKKQALDVAERFKNISIQKIISSPYTRAIETAQEIQKTTDMEIEQSDLFIEVKRPSELRGSTHDSNLHNDIFEQIIANEHDPEWRYSDEENFHDLVARVKEAIKFLEKHSEEELAVVTHSVFIRTMLGILTFQDKFSPAMLHSMGEHLKINNTGITVFEYKDNVWRLITWNDHAHLG